VRTKKTTDETKAPQEAPDVYLVIWEDAKVVSTGGAWHSNVEIPYTPYLVYQVGFLVKDVPEGVMLSEAWTTDLIGPPTQIPRGMIRGMKKLS
jgi:hypothetical protein